MDMVEMYGRALDRTEGIVEGTRREQFGDATPCDDWKVERLLDHMIGGCLMFAAAGSGEKDDALNESGNVGDDHVKAFRQAAEGALAAFKAPGAMERTFTLPVGETPAQVAVGLALADAVVHGWDLAQATGQDLAVDEDIAEAIYGFTAGMMEPKGQWPRRTAFKDAVEIDDGAPARDRMLAYLGRNP